MDDRLDTDYQARQAASEPIELPVEASSTTSPCLFAVESGRGLRTMTMEETLALMADVSEALGASLDETTTMQRVANTIVPRMADTCGVHLRDEHGQARLVAIADLDPARVELARRLGDETTVDPDAPFGPPHVLRTGAPELVPDVTLDHITARTTSQKQAALIEGIGCRSWMMVPVSWRGRVAGAIGLVSRTPGRRYDAADLAFAIEVARRAGIALENIRLYQEAQAANRMKDEFLAVVSHELRTPLTAIAGWTAMLLGERSRDPAFLRRGLEAIERNVKTQTHLIEDILDVSRISTGKLRIELVPVDIEKTLRDAAEAIAPCAAAKEVTLKIEGCNAPCRVLGDPDRLRQVLWNLLSNAVKFTPGGGRVTARVRRAGDIVLVAVADTGRGIPPAFLPHVFERFRQADSSTTRSHGGLGLGLALVRHLVELHGGSVSVESHGEGRGSTFTVALPSSQPPG